MRVLFLFSFLLNSSLLAAVDPGKLLKEAETIRNPKVSYEGMIKITDERPGKKDERTYRVKSKDQSTSIVEYVTPEPGTKVLMVGDDMWVAMPTAAKPIRVAPKQKLVGNAAYGDIASISYEDSYDPELKGEEILDGKKVYVLNLKAKPGKPVTYERIEYTIDKTTKRPLKAKYMTGSGKILREGTFTGYKTVLGVERPLTLVLKDALDHQLTTTMEFLDAKEKKFPQSLFQKDSLK